MYSDKLGCFGFVGVSIRDFDLGDVADFFDGPPLMFVCANRRCCEFMFLRVIVRQRRCRIRLRRNQVQIEGAGGYCCDGNSTLLKNIMFLEL
jgi:hypothetical protein